MRSSRDLPIDPLELPADDVAGVAALELSRRRGRRRASGLGLERLAQRRASATASPAPDAPAAGVRDDLAAAAVARDDHRRAAKERLDRHEPEDLVPPWIGDDVRVGERLEPLASRQEPREAHARAEAELADERPQCARSAPVVAGDHEPGVLRPSWANAATSTSRRLRAASACRGRARSLPPAIPKRARKAPGAGGMIAQSIGFGTTRISAGSAPRASSWRRSASVTAKRRAAPGRTLRPRVSRKSHLASRRRSMSGAVPWGESTYGTPARRRLRSAAIPSRWWQPCRCATSNVRASFFRMTGESERKKHLQVIGRGVREVGKHADLHAVLSPRRRPSGQRELARPRQSRPRVAGVGSAHLHLVTSFGEPPRASAAATRGIPPYAQACS